VEMGVTNENFQNGEENPSCATNGTPESHSGFNVGSTDAADIVAFMGFMKFLDQPTPVSSYGSVSMASINNGRALFVFTGCALCHTPTLTTGSSSTAALSHQPANLFSDLSVHHMGSNLADGVTQGTAGQDEFRTAPLWAWGSVCFPARRPALRPVACDWRALDGLRAAWRPAGWLRAVRGATSNPEVSWAKWVAEAGHPELPSFIVSGLEGLNSGAGPLSAAVLLARSGLRQNLK